MIPLVLQSIVTEVDYQGMSITAEDADGPLKVLAAVVIEGNAELRKEMAGLELLCRALKNGCLPAELDLAQRLDSFEEKLLIHFASEEVEESVATLVTDRP